MKMILGIIATLILIIVIMEIVTLTVYGKPIAKNELDYFLPKYLSNYELNEYDSKNKLLSYPGLGMDIPYIGSPYKSILFSDHIQDVGVIWRWSKHAKMIQAHRDNLIERIPKKSKGLMKY